MSLMNTPINFIPALPELWVLVATLVMLVIGLFAASWRRFPYYCAQGIVCVGVLLTLYLFMATGHATTTLTFNDNFIFDRLAMVTKLFIFIAVFFTFIYSQSYNDARKIQSLEFYVLSLFSLLGMMVLVSANSLLIVFLGLELLSLPIYAMVAMQKEKLRGIEAAMKYFVIGTLASGLLLYGLSMIFGATQSLQLAVIADHILLLPADQHLILTVGLIFVLAGLAFKLGAAPFHLWVPDVYEGAPSATTLFLAAAPKIAAFAVTVRLLVYMMPSLQTTWQPILMVIAVLSMAIGNFAAIVQSNIKRMLAYSSIAHMGYMLLGILCATPNGYAAALFYVITYSLITLGAFGMIILVSHDTFEAETIDDFVGLNNRNPWLALMMLLVMFALAGVPPLVGFIAKVGVLEALISVHAAWLAALAVLFAVVGAYYYIRVVKAMYFESKPGLLPLHYPLRMKFAISITGLATLIIGIFPGWLYSLSHYVFNL